jgi:hypothetical protein
MGTGANISGRRFDWRDHAQYNYTIPFSDRDWAWEGLRRNPDFRSAWSRARPVFDVQRAESGLTFVKAKGGDCNLGRWGVLYCDPPQLDARTASVVWQVSQTFVLRAMAFPERADDELGMFQLANAPCPSLLLAESNGFQHIVFGGKGCRLQLAVSGASLLGRVHLVTDIVVSGTDMKRHLRSQAMFNDLRTSGRSDLSDAVPQRRAERLRSVLQALDGFLAGATLREIGVALFGADRVARDWDDEHRHLKDRTRRAVARGKWLMGGGYLQYLK